MTGEWFGYIGATLTTLSFVPQAIKTIKTKETHGISLGMYAAFTVGVVFWLGYGIVLDSWPIIVSNIVTLALASTILGMKLKYG